MPYRGLFWVVTLPFEAPKEKFREKAQMRLTCLLATIESGLSLDTKASRRRFPLVAKILLAKYP
ncbi:hypothetical protein Q31b_30390 [Novipirellula aureliae]|uniref:Uncharacterized protein n=1 Tax=Novipirellula aureliae TaxID=2527966 RepID=A0A5C6DY94_9BACT|nr:hypothetical protein Q31b_30390 [Novipirellula aureliae]